MAVEDFLSSFGMGQSEEKDTWLDIIRPTTVSLILGQKGLGKSGLGYFLVDKVSRQYSLTPVAVNLPRDKQPLLPEHYVIKTLEELKHTGDVVALIDEGTTTLPAGQAKLEELVKSFVALSRQRNQVIIFVFHASSDVGSRILRGVDNILIKRPSQRQIQYGSKDAYCRALLIEAKERFQSLAEIGEDPRKYTFVDAETPPFHGILKNDLPDFWTEDLSKAWADTYNSAMFTLESLNGKPAVQAQTTEQRLLKYGAPREIHERVISMDREHSIEELQQMCRDKGLPTSGDKKKLASSLIMSEGENGEQGMDSGTG
ncbi:MAG TPA: hypothetical protein VMW37_04840 [Dehalococcoidales bacterium]|nr:hypothetical protein [Dehalococcoidales bacterium]